MLLSLSFCMACAGSGGGTENPSAPKTYPPKMVKGETVDLTLGFSHPVSYKLPAGVKAEVDKDGKLHVKSADKALLGQVASDLRNFRPPEPYKGKGVRYLNEKITLKEGKARGKGK